MTVSLDPALEPWVLIGLAVAAGLVVVLLVVWLFRAERRHDQAARRLEQLGEQTALLANAQLSLQGRLDQSFGTTETRLTALGDRLGDGLIRQTERTGESLRAVHERLAVVDRAQAALDDLAGRVTSLHGVLANKQARGAFGEMQLEDLVRSALPPSAYAFQVTLSIGTRADCMIRLPQPPGPIVVDAKFPLESYAAIGNAKSDAERLRARRALTADITRHLTDIAERYIVPGETAEQAMMFLPSEAVYSEVHAHCRGAVEESFRRRVWIVSPTTLWATLSTMRGILRDTWLRDHAAGIAAELRLLAADVGRLDQRTAKLQDHLRQTEEDIRQVRITTARIVKRATQIDMLDLVETDDKVTASSDNTPSAVQPLADVANR